MKKESGENENQGKVLGDRYKLCYDARFLVVTIPRQFHWRMKAVMKIYVVKGSFFLEEESEAEKDHSKEGRTSKKDLSTLLMTEEKLQWEEVTFSNMEKPKRPPENRG